MENSFGWEEMGEAYWLGKKWETIAPIGWDFRGYPCGNHRQVAYVTCRALVAAGHGPVCV
jgi:hypothetical protein